MKRLGVYVDLMQLLVIISNVGIMINVDTELIDKGVWDKGYVWNPSNCECECDKTFDVGEYLDYKNCKYRKRLIDKLAEECNEIVEETSSVKINSESANIIFVYCTLCNFQYSLQSILELVLILFITNT